MKKVFSVLFILFIYSAVTAQYKKASFFGKTGRTYELGAHMYALGDGKGSPIGFKLGFGSDKDGNRFFYNWDLQFIPSYKYGFTTTDNYDETISVSGASKFTILYGMNFNFHLLNNDNTERKIKPYVSLGINTLLTGGIKSETTTPESYDLKKQSARNNFTLGAGAGLGCLFNLTEKLGIKVQGGYNYQLNINPDKEPGVKTYYLFTNHAYASAGLRLRIAAE